MVRISAILPSRMGAKLTRFFLPPPRFRGEGGRRRRPGGVSPRDGSLSSCHAECREHACQDQSRGETSPVALARATLPAQARWREKRAIAALSDLNLAPMRPSRPFNVLLGAT